MITNQPYSSKRVSGNSSQPVISTSSTSTTGSLSRQSSISSNECHRCGKPFEVGSTNSSNGKLAVGQINGPLNTVFHQACFSCYRCEANLNVDSFFYAQKRLLCSRCVHESLEKCTICNFIINDRIIRVLGQPYHPKCFTCTACSCCLDGKAFTVDVHERLFCLDDFHKRYAPRCDACGEPIRPQFGGQENKRIISGDKTFHLECSGINIKKT